MSVIINILSSKNSNNFLNTCEWAPVSIIEIFCESKGMIVEFCWTGLATSTFFIIVGSKILSVSPSIQITLSEKNNSLLFKVRYCFTNLYPSLSVPYSSFKELKAFAVAVPLLRLK